MTVFHELQLQLQCAYRDCDGFSILFIHEEIQFFLTALQHNTCHN